MNYLYYLFIVLGFLAVVLFLEGLYVAWNSYSGPEAKRIEKRLRAMSADAADTQNPIFIKQRLLSKIAAIESLLLRVPGIHRLDKLLLQSGLQLNVAGFIGLSLLLAATGFVGAMLIHPNIFIAAAIGVAGGMLPLFYVQNAKSKRMTKIELQLPDALDLMGRAMLAGHAFSSALKMVGDEMPDPIAFEFRIVFDEINYGISVQDALKNLATRIPSMDLSYFVIAVLIQRETGGNLAELLGNISNLIRARLRLLGSVRVLATEGRLSAQILTVLPFVLALIIYMINPKHMSSLWNDPAGLNMIYGALGMIVAGIYIMSRIIKIRV